MSTGIGKLQYHLCALLRSEGPLSASQMARTVERPVRQVRTALRSLERRALVRRTEHRELGRSPVDLWVRTQVGLWASHPLWRPPKPAGTPSR